MMEKGDREYGLTFNGKKLEISKEDFRILFGTLDVTLWQANWTWHLYDQTKIPFIQAHVDGFEVRLQVWPGRKKDSPPRIRWDADSEGEMMAFGYMPTIWGAFRVARDALRSMNDCEEDRRR